MDLDIQVFVASSKFDSTEVFIKQVFKLIFVGLKLIAILISTVFIELVFKESAELVFKEPILVSIQLLIIASF